MQNFIRVLLFASSLNGEMTGVQKLSRLPILLSCRNQTPLANTQIVPSVHKIQQKNLLPEQETKNNKKKIDSFFTFNIIKYQFQMTDWI